MSLILSQQAVLGNSASGPAYIVQAEFETGSASAQDMNVYEPESHPGEHFVVWGSPLQPTQMYATGNAGDPADSFKRWGNNRTQRGIVIDSGEVLGFHVEMDMYRTAGYIMRHGWGVCINTLVSAESQPDGYRIYAGNVWGEPALQIYKDIGGLSVAASTNLSPTFASISPTDWHLEVERDLAGLITVNLYEITGGTPAEPTYGSLFGTCSYAAGTSELTTPGTHVGIGLADLGGNEFGGYNYGAGGGAFFLRAWML